MASQGWFKIPDVVSSSLPDNQYFEGDSAFSFLGLTRTQRIYGFGACALIGFVLQLLGVIFIGSLTIFATLYGFGTIVSLIGTGFIFGFFAQLKTMFKPVRVIASIVLIASIALIFVGAFVISSGILCIIFVIIQFLAYIWYTLSYIPYARTTVLKMIGLGG